MQSQHSHRILRWSGRALLGLLALLAGPAALGASYEAIMTSRDAERYPPPGQLVDVGGYRLHIDCQGQGGPTVVLVTGLGGSSLLWGRVQPGLAASSRVCACDRAGLGWSDAHSGPRTPSAVAAELHTLLTHAHIPGPYVLVGASIGGKYIRMFAEQQSFRRIRPAASRCQGRPASAGRRTKRPVAAAADRYDLSLTYVVRKPPWEQ